MLKNRILESYRTSSQKASLKRLLWGLILKGREEEESLLVFNPTTNKIRS